MGYRIAADLTVIVHFSFILFVVFGGLPAIRWPKTAWAHIPAAVWGVLIEFTGLICPLTPLENWLRRAGGEAGYSGGFIKHYLIPLIYPSGLTREVQLMLGVAVLVINLSIYGFVLYRWRRRRRSALRVCPVERAGHLDNRWRRWLQDPGKILGPFIRQGMTVLDVGCGPGFFSIEMARMVGETGRVIAGDLQQGMLDRVREKIRRTELEARITLHKCDEDRIGFAGPVDFVLAFYMVHEVADQDRFYAEVSALLGKGGQVLVVEPPFHVSKKRFAASLSRAREAGLTPHPGPRVRFCKTALLTKL